MKYDNELIHNMGLGDTITCICQFIFNKYDNYDTKIGQYFVIYVLGLWIRLNSYESHRFYAWKFSHNTELPIAINQKNITLI